MVATQINSRPCLKNNTSAEICGKNLTTLISYLWHLRRPKTHRLKLYREDPLVPILTNFEPKTHNKIWSSFDFLGYNKESVLKYLPQNVFYFILIQAIFSTTNKAQPFNQPCFNIEDFYTSSILLYGYGSKSFALTFNIVFLYTSSTITFISRFKLL